MHQHCVGALVVVNEDSEPVGIVTDRDLLERALIARLDPDETPVARVMTQLPKTIYEGSSVDTALSMMRDGPFRRLPVVDHEGKLVGLLCLDDLLMKTAQELGEMGKIVQRETPCCVAEESAAKTWS
jgi:CBS domain-containing protein